MRKTDGLPYLAALTSRIFPLLICGRRDSDRGRTSVADGRLWQPRRAAKVRSDADGDGGSRKTEAIHTSFQLHSDIQSPRGIGNLIATGQSNWLAIARPMVCRADVWKS